MESCWNTVKLKIKEMIPDHSYRMWIKPVAFLGSDDRCVRLSCPNPFSRQRILDNYASAIKEEFKKLGHTRLSIEIEISGGTKPRSRGSFPASTARPALRSSIPTQLALPGLNPVFDSGRMLKKNYTFDHFVVGSNSNYAYSASLALAKGAAHTNGALYLLSDTGLGKSHLSQAVGHHILSKGASEKVYYVTAEDFTNEMVGSLKSNTVNVFKEKYRRKCDVLILEDIHFLSGKEAIQKELVMTLDYLLDADKKIIFSGCYLPDDIPKMNDQLKSRLTLGLVTKIDVPDFDTRVRILKKKSEVNGYVVPADITEYLAQELCDNVRQLESGLNGVVARSRLLGETIDLNLAGSVVSTIARNKKRITIDFIKSLVCSEYRVTEQDLVSPSRKKSIVRPRQIAIFLAKKYTDQPLKKIGRSFNRYHATAIYSINAVEKEMKRRGDMFEQINYLYKKLETGRA